MSIQHALHQIWIGTKPLPQREAQWCAEMQRMNAVTWAYKLHGNELRECYAQDPYVKALWDSAETDPKQYAFLCDRLRMLILRDEGGVYLDCDCQPLQPLDTLTMWDRPTVDFVAGLRSPHRRDVALHRGVPLVDNTFLASAKGGRLVSRILSLWTTSSIVVDGHAIGVAILEHADQSVILLNHRYFYAEQAFPETVALHDGHNMGSWAVRHQKPLIIHA